MATRTAGRLLDPRLATTSSGTVIPVAVFPSKGNGRTDVPFGSPRVGVFMFGSPRVGVFMRVMRVSGKRA
jgi:hypothetical protein